jgi:hypothetical protein
MGSERPKNIRLLLDKPESFICLLDSLEQAVVSDGPVAQSVRAGDS